MNATFNKASNLVGKTLATGLALSAVDTAARAADLPPAPVYATPVYKAPAAVPYIDYFGNSTAAFFANAGAAFIKPSYNTNTAINGYSFRFEQSCMCVYSGGAERTVTTRNYNGKGAVIDSVGAGTAAALLTFGVNAAGIETDPFRAKDFKHAAIAVGTDAVIDFGAQYIGAALKQAFAKDKFTTCSTFDTWGQNDVPVSSASCGVINGHMPSLGTIGTRTAAAVGAQATLTWAFDDATRPGPRLSFGTLNK